MLAVLLASLALLQTPEAPPAPAPAPPAKTARPPRPSAPPARAGVAPEEPGALRGEWPATPSGRRVTLDDTTSLDDALDQIADAAGWNAVLNTGRAGSTQLVLRLRDVPVEDALRAVLAGSGLTATRQGATVIVSEARGTRGPPGATADLGRGAERAERDAEPRPRGRGASRDRVVHGDVVVEPAQEARDIVALRGNVRLKPGARARAIVTILGSVTLEAGAHAREVTAVGGSVQVGPGAEIERDAISVGGQVRVDPGGDVGGEQTSVEVPGISGLGALIGSGLLFGAAASPLLVTAQVLAKFAMYFALGLVFLALFPRRVETVAATMVASPWKSVLAGVLGAVASPLLTVLLVVTVIGILLVPVQLLAILAAGVLGFTGLAFHLGRSLPASLHRGAAVLQLAIGTAIVVLVTQVPVLGALAWISGALLTFGAVIRSRFGSHGGPVLPTTVAPPPAAAAAQ
jgi:hypothetical protein